MANENLTDQLRTVEDQTIDHNFRAIADHIDRVIGDLSDTIRNTIVDAKGDLIVATADNVVARRAVGINGYALIADSTTGYGLAWKKKGFVDRGDAGLDYVIGDFTKDGAWHDLFLSSIVTDSDAKSVLMHLQIKGSAVGLLVQFRKKGYTNATKVYQRTQVANIDNQMPFAVACDVNQVIQYWIASSASWTTINLMVHGWWI